MCHHATHEAVLITTVTSNLFENFAWLCPLTCKLAMILRAPPNVTILICEGFDHPLLILCLDLWQVLKELQEDGVSDFEIATLLHAV